MTCTDGVAGTCNDGRPFDDHRDDAGQRDRHRLRRHSEQRTGHRRGRGSGPDQGINPGSLRNVLTDRVFRTFVALFFVFQLIFKQNNAGLPLAVQRDGLDATAYGWIYVVNTLLIVIGQLFLPRLIRDRAHSKVLALGVFLVGVGFGMTALADAAWFYAVTVAVWTLGEMAYFSVLDASVAGLAPSHLRGRYFGVLSSASQLSRFAAPLLAGYLLHSYGELLWIACLVTGVGAAAAYLLTARLREHRILLPHEHRRDEGVRIQ
jgi:MFS family permease